MTVLALMLSLLVSESYRTEVIFLTELPAERALVLHERLIGQAGESSITLGRQPNVIVLRDTAPRLQRFRDLLALLDVRGAAEMHIYVRPVQNLAPSELVALATEVMDARAIGKVRLLADDRSRQLLAMCRPSVYLVLDRLLRRLDVPAEGGKRTRVTPAPADSKPGDFPP